MPEWLQPLLAQLEREEPAERVRRMLASRVLQKPGPDEAAVLICFMGSSFEDAAVLLTHRHPSMRSHSGQMAFPGGRIDPEDVDAVAAALREAQEETGLDPARVKPLALMPAVTTGGSRRRVRPVVAFSADPGEVYPASLEETDDVFFVPLAELVDPANRCELGWDAWHGPAFRVGCYIVWGFTGALLSVLLDLGGWSVEWDRTPRDLAAALEDSCNGEAW